MGEKTKICTKCGEGFPSTPEFFHRKSASRDGLASWCAACANKHNRQYKIKRGGNGFDIAADLPGEEWSPVIGYADLYAVSNLGRIKRTADGVRTFRGRLLKPFITKSGYVHVCFKVDGRVKCFMRHRLVAAAFIGPRPDGMQVNHKNGVKDDNRVENLEYLTPSQNVKHSFRIGIKTTLGENNPRHILTECDVRKIRALLRDEVMTLKEIGDMFGVSKSAIANIKYGHSWSNIK